MKRRSIDLPKASAGLALAFGLPALHCVPPTSSPISRRLLAICCTRTALVSQSSGIIQLFLLCIVDSIVETATSFFIHFTLCYVTILTSQLPFSYPSTTTIHLFTIHITYHYCVLHPSPSSSNALSLAFDVSVLMMRRG